MFKRPLRWQCDADFRIQIAACDVRYYRGRAIWRYPGSLIEGSLLVKRNVKRRRPAANLRFSDD